MKSIWMNNFSVITQILYLSELFEAQLRRYFEQTDMDKQEVDNLCTSLVPSLIADVVQAMDLEMNMEGKS